MSYRKWFALIDGQVKGPFRQDDLEGRLPSLAHALIWGRGQSAWIAADKWIKHTKELEQKATSALATPERLWRVLIDDKELPPMTHEEMINQLKNKTDLTNIRLWTEGYSEWREIYQIHKIMDELGVSRRTHPRVPIMGTLVCEGAGSSFNARLLSISEGGLGATEGKQVKIGERFKILLKSSNLSIPIHATVEVVYVGTEAYFGMKFIALQSESQSVIIEYIKKFLVSNPNIK